MPEVFDKHQLHGAVLAALQALVDNARQAVLTAYESATHEENIAENKYDTLGLEAGRAGWQNVKRTCWRFKIVCPGFLMRMT